MKPHLIIKLRDPLPLRLVSWERSLREKSGTPTRFIPAVDRLLDELHLPFWATAEYEPRGSEWSFDEISSGLNRMYRLILQVETEFQPSLLENIRLIPQVEYVRVGNIGQTNLPNQKIATASSVVQGYRDDKTGLRPAHVFTTGKPEIVVAVLDTGVDLKHPEISHTLLPGADFVDIIDGAMDFIGDYLGFDQTPFDEVGHGTHVTGILAGRGHHMPIGVAPNCKILPVRVLGALKREGTVVGAGLIDNINTGIKWAVDQGADVINMSLGIRHEHGGLPHEEVIEYAIKRGVTVVAAAGNDGTSDRYYPGALPGVIAVGAVNDADEVASFSTYGAHISVTAPGDKIYSSFTNGGYAFSSGTSQAAPFVSGAVALLKSLALENGLQLKDGQVKYLLKHTCDKPNTAFRTEKAGFGRLNIYDAMKMLKYLI